MAGKVALFAFNGDPMCVIHVLLNTLDMHDRGYDVRLVIEGAATKLVASMSVPDDPLHGLYTQVKDKGLVHCVCNACASKMGTLASANEQGLPVGGPMMGHPSMAEYRDEGYDILIF
ncbi:MAG: DsrE family protein [Candidatus Thermoplasmatota archaeon]|nr:DsrE family protein [Candidatus Thermoplasmatota archaeon]